MDIDELLAEPRRRRLWLLTEAMASGPLDRALELAKAADEFVLGATETTEPVKATDESVLSTTETTQTEQASTANAPKNAECQAAPSRSSHEEPKAGLLSLLPERREELLDRMARGETNAALAAEFGLTPMQIQGFRMGAARRIASRRSAAHGTMQQDLPDRISASIEDVVRYLRQQDDVVVPEGSDRYVVNGRFHLDLAELLAKANRIRARHNKPLFQLRGLPANGRADQIMRPAAISASRLSAVSPETQH